VFSSSPLQARAKDALLLAVTSVPRNRQHAASKTL